MLKYMQNIYGSEGVALLFLIFMYPQLSEKSKEELIDYAKEIKERGDMTEEQYQKAIEFIDKIEELKQMIKNKKDKQDD
jgi:hypothetical protein